MKIITTFDELNKQIDAHTFTLIYVSSENCSVCKADHPIVQKWWKTMTFQHTKLLLTKCQKQSDN